MLLLLLGAAPAGTAVAGPPVSFAVTGPDGQPAAGVVVYLPDVRTPAPQPPVVIDQQFEAFMPEVAVATAGSEVQFTNSDRTSHHVYSFSKPNAFELPLYKGNGRQTQRFEAPGVVVLGCNIHDSMLGYVVVVASTRAGVTGADGRVTLADVPAGRHVVRAWAPGFDRAQHPQVAVVEVNDAAPAEVPVRIGATGAAPSSKKRGSLVGSDY